MLEPRFCYRISKEAGLANDGQGNKASCYTQIHFEGGKKLSEEQYAELHLSVKETVINQLKVPKSYLELISQKEFDDNHDDE